MYSAVGGRGACSRFLTVTSDAAVNAGISVRASAIDSLGAYQSRTAGPYVDSTFSFLRDRQTCPTAAAPFDIPTSSV